MQTQRFHFGFVVLALSCALGLASSADAARGPSPSPANALASIRTIVDSAPVPSDPDGTCSQCLARTDGTSEEATVEVDFEDNGQDFSGDYRLVLELDKAEFRTIYIEDVDQDHQTTKSYVVPAGSDWDWDEVVEVTFSALPD